MPGEIPSHQPNPQELGPNAMTYAAAMDIRTGQEALHDGARQLAGNVVRLMETGDPKAVKEYLGDVLTDTEKLVPAAERMAAFEFLAGEQRGEIRRGLVASGEQMLDIYLQAASDVGNVTVTPIAQAGEQFDGWPDSKVPHSLTRVDPGNVAVTISGILDPGYGLTPLYDRVREIEAEQAAEKSKDPDEL